MKVQNYLNDGYTRKGFIKGVPQMYEDVRFVYRPAVILERSEIWDSSQGQKPATTLNKMSAVAMAKKIKSWDIKDSQGSEVKITPQNILEGIHPELFTALENIVFGYRPSDVDPEWETETKQSEFEVQLDALVKGQDVGTTRDEATVKN